jgi:hypothetical protein
VVQQIDFVIHFNNNTWNNNNGQDYHIPINPIQPFSLNLKAFLEGPFNGISMNASLSELVDFPHYQPFQSSPWNYNGSEAAEIIPPDAVDWVLVEIRDALSAPLAVTSTIVGRQPGFILSDGSIKRIDGISDIQFLVNINHNLFVVIYQRNHLAVMSSNPLVKSGNSYSYNFSTSSVQGYGGTDAQNEIVPGTWGLISGDGDHDGHVLLPDENPLWKNDTGKKGYLNTDFNLDSQVNNMDKNDFWFPNSGKGTQVPD